MPCSLRPAPTRRSQTDASSSETTLADTAASSSIREGDLNRSCRVSMASGMTVAIMMMNCATRTRTTAIRRSSRMKLASSGAAAKLNANSATLITMMTPNAGFSREIQILPLHEHRSQSGFRQNQKKCDEH